MGVGARMKGWACLDEGEGVGESVGMYGRGIGGWVLVGVGARMKVWVCLDKGEGAGVGGWGVC